MNSNMWHLEIFVLLLKFTIIAKTQDTHPDCNYSQDICDEIYSYQKSQLDINEAEAETEEGFCLDSTWIPYKNEKCFKLMDTSLNFEDALSICRSLAPDHSTTLATVKGDTEHHFLSQQLQLHHGRQTHGRRVWLGAFEFLIPNATTSRLLKWIGDNNPFVSQYMSYNSLNSEDENDDIKCLQMSPLKMRKPKDVERSSKITVEDTTITENYSTVDDTTITENYSTVDDETTTQNYSLEPTNATSDPEEYDVSENDEIDSAFGLFSLGSCRARNYFVCQAVQSISYMKLQKLVLEIANLKAGEKISKLRDDFNKMVADNRDKSTQLETSLLNLEDNFRVLENSHSDTHRNVLKLNKTQDSLHEMHTGAHELILRELQTSNYKIVGLKTELDVSKNKVTALEGNPVPIGFIYIQLPRRSDPRTLWPRVTWEDVSANYAGLFFRVEGGQSASFGVNQASDSPRLTQVNYYDDPDAAITHGTSISVASISAPVRSGRYYGENHDKIALTFLVSGGETRPINTAIKIWMRVR